MTTLAMRTNDEAPPGIRPPGAAGKRMPVFATAAHAVQDRGHP